MQCAWKELLAILPAWLKRELDFHEADMLQEIRLRINAPPELLISGQIHWLGREVTKDDLNFCINTASRYSPWSAATVSSGFITAPGGHRIGICGECVIKNGKMAGIREITSLCIRVARDFPGVGATLAEKNTSVLILGAPGWGKTTLLRDLIRQRSDMDEHICVVDQRLELFPQGHFNPGRCTDVLTGCQKSEGVEMLLRTMGPGCIAVDEITAESDCQALLQAAWCGVSLIATAHASSIMDFERRPVYASLARTQIFDLIVILHPDKSWHLERRRTCLTNGSVRL